MGKQAEPRLQPKPEPAQAQSAPQSRLKLSKKIHKMQSVVFEQPGYEESFDMPKTKRKSNLLEKQNVVKNSLSARNSFDKGKIIMFSSIPEAGKKASPPRKVAVMSQRYFKHVEEEAKIRDKESDKVAFTRKLRSSQMKANEKTSSLSPAKDALKEENSAAKAQSKERGGRSKPGEAGGLQG